MNIIKNIFSAMKLASPVKMSEAEKKAQKTRTIIKLVDEAIASFISAAKTFDRVAVHNLPADEVALESSVAISEMQMHLAKTPIVLEEGDTPEEVFLAIMKIAHFIRNMDVSESEALAIAVALPDVTKVLKRYAQVMEAQHA